MGWDEDRGVLVVKYGVCNVCMEYRVRSRYSMYGVIMDPMLLLTYRAWHVVVHGTRSMEDNWIPRKGRRKSKPPGQFAADAISCVHTYILTSRILIYVVHTELDLLYVPPYFGSYSQITLSGLVTPYGVLNLDKQGKEVATIGSDMTSLPALDDRSGYGISLRMGMITNM